MASARREARNRNRTAEAEASQENESSRTIAVKVVTEVFASSEQGQCDIFTLLMNAFLERLSQLLLAHLLLERMAETEHDLAGQKTYDPNALLDTLIERLQLKNDAALCRLLEVGPPVISNIRHKRLPIGSSMLIRMHEVSNLTIRELRYLMGDRRTRYRENEPSQSKSIADANNATLN